MIRHWYHIYSDGSAWREAVDEHVAALKAAQIPMRAIAGVLGNRAQEAIRYARTTGLFDSCIEVHGQWEQATMQLIVDALPEMDEDDMVMYAHTKGAYCNTDRNRQWRRGMTNQLVCQWRAAVALLDSGHDTVGCHWMTPEHQPGVIKNGFYAGNYWWAKGSHLKRLGPIEATTRYDAESWIGSVEPVNPGGFLPGWPTDYYT